MGYPIALQSRALALINHNNVHAFTIPSSSQTHAFTPTNESPNFIRGTQVNARQFIVKTNCFIAQSVLKHSRSALKFFIKCIVSNNYRKSLD